MAALRLYGIQDGGPYLYSVSQTAAIPVLCIQNGGHIPVFCIQDGGHTCTLYPGYALLLLVVVLHVLCIQKTAALPVLCIQDMRCCWWC